MERELRVGITAMFSSVAPRLLLHGPTHRPFRASMFSKATNDVVNVQAMIATTPTATLTSYGEASPPSGPNTNSPAVRTTSKAFWATTYRSVE